MKHKIYKKDYFGFVYRWTNTRNGKFYIGSHYGRVDGRYKGSGKYFRNAYAKEPEVFQREILEYIKKDCRDTILKREQKWLDKIENIVNNKQCYNLSPFAGGGYNHGHLTKKRRQEIYSNRRTASLNRLKSMTTEEKEKLAESKRNSWDSWDEKRKKKYKQDHGDKLRNHHENKSKKQKADYSKKQSSVIKAIKVNDQEKWNNWQAKKSESVRLSHVNMSKDDKKKRGKNISKSKSGTIVIRNLELNKSIHIRPEELKKYIRLGWERGMLSCNRNSCTGKIMINNGKERKFILPDELQKYVKLGWKKGKGTLK